MPKKNLVSPTVTEGRSRRTPKPNPKYAVDYVAKLRRSLTPERRDEDDDEYKPTPKRRLGDTSVESPTATSAKSTTKKVLVQPKLSVEKTKKGPGVQKSVTPMMSRLASLRNSNSRVSITPPRSLSKSSSPKNVTPVSTTSKIDSTKKMESAVQKDSEQKKEPFSKMTTAITRNAGKTEEREIIITRSAEKTESKKLSPTSIVTKGGEKLENKRNTPTIKSAEKTMTRSADKSDTKKGSPVVSTAKRELNRRNTPTLKNAEKPEITIVNIEDIMKSSTDTKRKTQGVSENKRKGSDSDLYPAKRLRSESDDVEMIDFEEQITVSNRISRTTKAQDMKVATVKLENISSRVAKNQAVSKSPIAASTNKQSPGLKQSPNLKSSPNFKQTPTLKQSPVMKQSPTKKQLSVSNKDTEIKFQMQPIRTTVVKQKPVAKYSNLSKKGESQEELGQELAKRILRKAVKPTTSESTIIKVEHSKKLIEKKIEVHVPKKIKKPIDYTKIKKITTFENWNILNFPQIQPQPARSVLCLSLIKLGNQIKQIKLPSSNWSYRITLQKTSKENSDKGEVYTGDIQECGITEKDKTNYAPVNITFQRCNSQEDDVSPDRSVIFQNKSFSLFMDGRPCKLIGAPQYIYDLSEIQTLLHIIDQVDGLHSYVDQAEK